MRRAVPVDTRCLRLPPGFVMALAFILSPLCSTSDAFIAATLDQFS